MHMNVSEHEKIIDAFKLLLVSNTEKTVEGSSNQFSEIGENQACGKTIDNHYW